MKSKNKNLFLKIYIPFVIITVVILIVLQILGSKKRVGYLTDFNLEIDRTLKLNNLTNIKENFIIDDELDEESIKNYLLTNENITNYVYQFRIRYYDKIFRNSDIYGVYVDLSSLPDYMENVEMEKGGSPYGYFVSGRKTIEDEKIDNVSYILKVKPNIVKSIILLLLITFILYYLYLFKINKLENINIVPFIIPILTFVMFIRNIHSITNAQLWAEDANIFLQGCLDYGVKSLFMPYAGYLHTIPRLIMIISYKLSHLLNRGILLIPFFSVILSTIIGAFCMGYVCSKSFSWLAPLIFRILLALLLCFVPQTSEVYYNPTNLHWLLGYFLFLVSINIIHYKSFPKGLILIMIFLSSISSTFVIFIGFASGFLFLNYLYNLIQTNKLKYNIKNIINKSFELLLVNLGLIIHAIVILFGKRAGAGSPSISYILEAGLYLIARVFIDINNIESVYIVILLIFLTAISIKFLKLKYYYILLFYIISIFMISTGNNLENFKFYLSNVRYIFIPTSILLTFIIANLYLDILNINNNKISCIISTSLIIIICIHYIIFNFENTFQLADLNWKEFSLVYYDKGKDKIFIPVNPENRSGWGVNVNANNILILNDFNISDNKLYISNINAINTNSFLYFIKNKNFDINIICENINNNYIYLELNKYNYDNKYYFVDLNDTRNMTLEIKLYTNDYNDILNNIRIYEAVYRK